MGSVIFSITFNNTENTTKSNTIRNTIRNTISNIISNTILPYKTVYSIQSTRGVWIRCEGHSPRPKAPPPLKVI